MIESRSWLLALALAVCAPALALACGGDDDGEAEPTATATATSTPAAAAPTPASGGATAPNDEIILRFDQWDATLTIPPGALPEGVSADDVSASPIELLDPEPDTLPVLAAFELLPDGIELSEPATLEFTVPLGPDRALIAALLDGDRGLVPLGITDEGDGTFAFERLDGISVRVTVTVPHFSTWWFYEGQRAICFDQEPLALTYQVGSSFSVSTEIARLDHRLRFGGGGDYEWLLPLLYDPDDPLESPPEVPYLVMIGGELTGWRVRSEPFWRTIGPVSIVSFSEGPNLDLSAAARIAGLTATVECDAVGSFVISVNPEVIIEFSDISAFQRIGSQAELRPYPGGAFTEWYSSPRGESVFWESECVAEPLPTVTATPVTTAPEDDDSPEDPTEQPTEQPTEVPSDPASRLKQLALDLHNKTVAFSATFSNGSCARYPPSYTQPLTVDFQSPNVLTLRQGAHVNNGTLNFDTGFAKLVEQGIERYEILFVTPDGKVLTFSGDYYFDDGQGECKWSVSGK